MTSGIVSALDELNIKRGENDHPELNWTKERTNLNEILVQLNFQLTRGCEVKNISQKIYDFLDIVLNKDIGTNIEEYKKSEAIKDFFCMIAYTRDIVKGKGEYNLTYELIETVYQYSKRVKRYEQSVSLVNICKMMIEKLVLDENNEHPLGSWKDLKYFANNHVKKNNLITEQEICLESNPLLKKVVNLYVNEIKKDIKQGDKLSLVARWVPREHSKKFGWLTKYIAEELFVDYIRTSSKETRSAAKRKAAMDYRKLVAKLNKNLNTPQIKQCEGKWGEINFNKDVTSITLRKQNNAFSNKTKLGMQRSNLEDRKMCKENFTKFLEDCKTGKAIAKGKRVSIIDFIKAARNNEDGSEDELLDLQWNNNREQNKELENMIAMVDTSGSMECDGNIPLNSAIGLGLRIAEKSKLGNRVMTFSAHPTWINLEDCDKLTEKVRRVMSGNWGMNTDFYAALELILTAAYNKGLSGEEMRNLSLVILSDMQIDNGLMAKDRNNRGILFDRIKERFLEYGYEDIPHIIFWNLRPTDGFPNLSTTKNTSMVSGNNPIILNEFCKKGKDFLKELTPWKVLSTALNNNRYNSIRDQVDKEIRIM